MGHKKFECEKKRQGAPSLNYEVYEMRCSPFKKYEHRSHHIPPAGILSKRGLSFASFGTAESCKSYTLHTRPTSPAAAMPEQVGSRDGFDDNEEEMPGLEEDDLAA